MNKTSIIQKTLLKLGQLNFQNKENLASFIQQKFIELRDIVKRYPKIKTNLSEIEIKVKEELAQQCRSENPNVIFRYPGKLILSEEVYLTKEQKQFKREYKMWLQNMIAHLNLAKKNFSWINIKEIITPLTQMKFMK